MIRSILYFINKNDFNKNFNNALIYWSLFFIDNFKKINLNNYIKFEKYIDSLKINNSEKFIAIYSVRLLYNFNSCSLVNNSIKKLFYLSVLTESINDDDLRLLLKFALTSGLSISEIIKLKWKSLTIIDNIMLINNPKRTKLCVFANYINDDLLNFDKSKTYIFDNQRKQSSNLSKKINKIIKFHSKKLFNKSFNMIDLLTCYNDNIIIPDESLFYANKYLLKTNYISNNSKLSEKEFNKIRKIKSIL